MKPYFEEDGITIYHGDCREVLPELPSESATMVWTDPPYGHSNHVDDLNHRLNEMRSVENKPIQGDGQKEMRRLLDFALDEAARILKRDCCCCCCCCGGGGPSPTFAWVAQRMDQDGLQFFHSVIWDKLNPGLGWRYRRRYEMVMIAHRKGGKLAWADDTVAVPNVFSQFIERDREHPNGKPIELPALFISLHSATSDLILDPFMGSGTALVAAKNQGRRAIGIEIEEKYCEIAANRLRQKVLAFSAS